MQGLQRVVRAVRPHQRSRELSQVRFHFSQSARFLVNRLLKPHLMQSRYGNSQRCMRERLDEYCGGRGTFGFNFIRLGALNFRNRRNYSAAAATIIIIDIDSR